ncbi:hypothetical protein VKT23_012440 [Stygiomarasmius scandens]|uniref:Uncharacterized protein n=1 Tax=Marasmiellus scandens TaxID=2682957 RepID=A0ABR1J6K2_9AGAR
MFIEGTKNRQEVTLTNEEQARGYFDKPLEYASDREEETKDDDKPPSSDSSESEYSSESEEDSVEGSEMAIIEILSLKQENGSDNGSSDYEMDNNFQVVQTELTPGELAQREREETWSISAGVRS